VKKRLRGSEARLFQQVGLLKLLRYFILALGFASYRVLARHLRELFFTKADLFLAWRRTEFMVNDNTPFPGRRLALF